MNDTALDRVQAVASLALTGVTVYLALRVVLGADGLRTVRMHACKAGESFCQRQAEFWARSADSLASQYDKARSVTV